MLGDDARPPRPRRRPVRPVPGVVGVHRDVGRTGGEGGQDRHIERIAARRHPDADPVSAADSAGGQPCHPLLDVGDHLGVGQLDGAVVDAGGIRVPGRGVVEDVDEGPGCGGVSRQQILRRNFGTATPVNPRAQGTAPVVRHLWRRGEYSFAAASSPRRPKAVRFRGSRPDYFGRAEETSGVGLTAGGSPRMNVSPIEWGITLAVTLAVLLADLLILGRRPHAPSRMGVRVAWLSFYIGLAIAFGLWVWHFHGSQPGLEFYAGWLTEYSLSVDNLFIFIIIMASFKVPEKLQQQALFVGIVLALIFRGIFIALGAVAIQEFSWIFYIFGASWSSPRSSWPGTPSTTTTVRTRWSASRGPTSTPLTAGTCSSSTSQTGPQAVDDADVPGRSSRWAPPTCCSRWIYPGDDGLTKESYLVFIIT